MDYGKSDPSSEILDLVDRIEKIGVIGDYLFADVSQSAPEYVIAALEGLPVPCWVHFGKGDVWKNPEFVRLFDHHPVEVLTPDHAAKSALDPYTHEDMFTHRDDEVQETHASIAFQSRVMSYKEGKPVTYVAHVVKWPVTHPYAGTIGVAGTVTIKAAA